MGQGARGAAQLWLRMFPEKRELILRTDGRVRYLSVTRGWQQAAAGAVLLAAGWGAVATYGFIDAASQVRVQARHIASAEVDRQALVAERDLLRLGMEALAGELALVEAERENALGARDNLFVRVSALDGELDQLFRVQRDLEAAQIELDRANLSDKVAVLEQQTNEQVALLHRQTVEQSALRRSARTKVRQLETQLASLQEERIELEAERGQLADRVETLGSMLARLSRANRTLLESLGERTREREDLGTEVARLSDRLVKLQRDQVGVLARLDARTSDSVEIMQRIVTMAGLDPDRMLGRVGAPPLGRGGPFVEFAITEPASLLEIQIDELDTRVDQWRGLRDLIERLPLTAPLDGYQITSTFGGRKDPVSGRPAMHEGNDMIGRSRALILSPAPGKVTFVGWNGGYGKMVEVDHGMGIRTRYAHMGKIYVKRGQEISFRQRLGQMGSTGRSTGEHLHYEIRVDGTPVDPETFLRAGVFAFSG